MRLLVIGIFFICLLECEKIHAGVPYNPYEQEKYKNAMESQGLYDMNDKVILLSDNNFKVNIFNKNHSTVVEFYNSYCGFCRRFAPTWKKFAQDVHSWKHMVVISAIDCSRDENNGICRDFEIMAYPTIKYFPPNYKDTKTNLGETFHGADEIELRTALMQILEKGENRVSSWPDLTLFNDISSLPTTQHNNIKYIFTITEPVGKYTAANIILDLDSKQINSKIYRISSNEELLTLNVLDHNHRITNQNLITSKSKDIIINAIENFLKNNHIQSQISEEIEDNNMTNDNVENSSINPKLTLLLDKIINLKKKDIIFQSDLETVIQYIVFHEIPGQHKITGERLIALQNLLTVVAKYFPSNLNGRSFLRELRTIVFNSSDEIDGAEFLNNANALKLKWYPAFSSNQWVGCHSNVKGLRRYPCGLWTLFHFLTVQEAVISDSSTLEVLPAMYGYIKHFFGCTDCSKHFIEMAQRREMDEITSRDDAILWLWEAHNEVNKRLSGDETEDPTFPKIQFPSSEGCSICRVTNPHHRISDENEEPLWNKNEVLIHLKNIYNYHNLNILSFESELAAPLSSKGDSISNHSFGKVLSDLDMRMGILLYIFCIAMMIIAVKIFLRRGYRKKMYLHDLLGKV